MTFVILRTVSYAKQQLANQITLSIIDFIMIKNSARGGTYLKVSENILKF